MKTLAPSLHRIEAILELLDHPERGIQAIHIAGTNGKSSAARIAASLLAASGLKVGTFTSPHLSSVRERIALDGDALTERAFGDVFDRLHPYLVHVEDRLGEKLSYFEVLTAMFFLWASEQPVDVAVIETGLGGTWDATNVVEAQVALITGIGLDHTDLLGSDRLGIAKEKAGIIKQDAVAVIAERSPDLQSFIAESAVDAGAMVSLAGRDFEAMENRVAYGGRYLSLRTHRRTYEGLFLPLHGAHQGRNAAAAVEAVARLLGGEPLDEAVVAAGLDSVRVPGRMEPAHIEGIEVPVLLDVAHNPDGMSALVTSLAEAFAFERVLVVAGFLREKDHAGMLAEIGRLPARLFLTRPPDARGLHPSSYLDEAVAVDPDAVVFDDTKAAFEAAAGEASKADLILVTGSHYVVGALRSHLVGSPQKGG